MRGDILRHNYSSLTVILVLAIPFFTACSSKKESEVNRKKYFVLGDPMKVVEGAKFSASLESFPDEVLDLEYKMDGVYSFENQVEVVATTNNEPENSSSKDGNEFKEGEKVSEVHDAIFKTPFKISKSSTNNAINISISNDKYSWKIVNCGPKKLCIHEMENGKSTLEKDEKIELMHVSFSDDLRAFSLLTYMTDSQTKNKVLAAVYFRAAEEFNEFQIKKTGLYRLRTSVEEKC